MTQTFQSFQNYIQSLAVSNKLIDHGGTRKSFYRMDNPEDVAATSGKGSSPYVSIANFYGQVKQQTSIVQVGVLNFLTTVPTAKNNLADEIEKAYQQSFIIMMQFWAKMLFELEEEDGCSFMTNLLDPSFEPIGPINTNDYGWQLSVRFSTDAPDHNPNNWK